jgi:peptide deformylase
LHPLLRIDRERRFPYLTAMSKLNIITLPDPMLRQKSEPLERVDSEVRLLIDDMLETMYAAPGIGLAAIQVAVPKRLLVLDIAEESAPRAPIAMVNPEILHLGSGTRVYEEGCLSLPGVRIDIERPTSLTVRYIDRNGERQQLEASGLLATAIQHEVDHLDGKLIIDFLSRLKRDMVVRKFKKSARSGADL